MVGRLGRLFSRAESFLASIPSPKFPDPLRAAGRTKPTQTRTEPPRERVLAERRYLYVLPVLFLEYLALR